METKNNHLEVSRMAAWSSNTTKNFNYYLNFYADRYADEEYCRKYSDNRGLVKNIIAQLVTIEEQKGRLDVLIDPEYHVGYNHTIWPNQVFRNI